MAPSSPDLPPSLPQTASPSSPAPNPDGSPGAAVDTDPHGHGAAALAWMRGTAKALDLGGDEDEGPFFLARRLTYYLDCQRDAVMRQSQDLEEALALLRQARPEAGTANATGWRRRWRVLLGRYPEPEDTPSGAAHSRGRGHDRQGRG